MKSITEELLDRVYMRYSSLSSYGDCGKVTTIRSDCVGTYEVSFSTLFARPNLLRLEFCCPLSQTPLGKEVDRYIVGSDGKLSYFFTEWYGGNKKLEFTASMQAALEAATGVSLGASWLTGELLSPGSKRFSLRDLVDLRIVGEELIGSEFCYVLQGTHPVSGDLNGLSIEKDTCLVRKLSVIRPDGTDVQVRDNLSVDRTLKLGRFRIPKAT